MKVKIVEENARPMTTRKKSCTAKSATQSRRGAVRGTSMRQVPAGADAGVEPAPVAAAFKVKRIRNFRCHAKHEISGAFSEIVHTLIEEAKGGSVNHTKLLFDIGGVKEQLRPKQKDDSGVSLADLLRRALSPEPQQAGKEGSPVPSEAGHVEVGPVSGTSR